MKKTKEITDYLKFLQKLKVIKYAQERGKNKEAYELFGIRKSTFYKWKKEFDKLGEKGLLRKKPIAYNFPNQIKPDVVKKVWNSAKTTNWAHGGLSGI